MTDVDLAREGVFGEEPAQLDARMVFTDDLSLLYIAIPKTGCTAVKTLLAGPAGLLGRETAPWRSSPRVHKAWRDRPGNWSSLSPDRRARLLEGPGVFRFTSVRNPFERIVSCYLNKVAPLGGRTGLAARMRAGGVDSLLSFLEAVAGEAPLVRDVHCRAMTDLCRPDRIVFEQIIRYECFEADVRTAMAAAGLGDRPPPQPPWSNRTNAGAHLAELLGSRERDLVRAIYRDDFEAFGYDPRSLPG